MLIPKARGPFSASLFARMQSDLPVADLDASTARDEDDAQIALWAMYELHYRGFDDAADEWEWDPGLLSLRGALEEKFESYLRKRFDQPDVRADPVAALQALIGEHEGPSLARFVQRSADRDQVLEILRHRSIYHLKESDPQSWVIPRLSTAPKAALMELQADEYGNGDPNRLHAHLFAEGLASAGLSAEYGTYIDDAPAQTLAMNNAMSMFGLHRRLRGAALGHLAAFEATSSIPSRRIARGLERVGLPAAIIHYYMEHVEADAVHEQLALRTICGALMRENPGLVGSILFGAATCLGLEDDYASAMLMQFEEAR